MRASKFRNIQAWGSEFPFRYICCKRLFLFVCLFLPLSILFEFHLYGISKPLMFHGYRSSNNRALNLQLIPAHQIVKVPELNFIYSYYEFSVCVNSLCSLNEHLLGCVCWREFVIIPDVSQSLLGV